MSDQLVIAVLGTVVALANTVAIIYGIRVSQGNHQVAVRMETKVDRVETKVVAVEKHTNGMLAKAQTATDTAVAVSDARAEGLLAGAQQERDRDPKA